MAPRVDLLDYRDKKLWYLVFHGLLEVLKVLYLLATLGLNILQFLSFFCLLFFPQSLLFSFIFIILKQRRSKFGAANIVRTIMPTLHMLKKQKVVERGALVVFVIFEITDDCILLLAILWQQLQNVGIDWDSVVPYDDASWLVLA